MIFNYSDEGSYKMSKPNKLLLVATFRHYFIGLGLALNDKGHCYHLIFINQNFDDERNPIYQASKKLVEPFASVSCLPLRTSGFKQKVQSRKVAFKILEKTISSLKPVEISTGNDRRLEFQYAMHYARNVLKLDVKGAYLDNGNGSYISYEKLNLKKYLVRIWVDIPIKKLFYGFWFSKAAKYGDSHWIDKCYLCHPSYAPSELRRKECTEVKVEFYQTGQAKRVLGGLVEYLGLEFQPEIMGRSLLITLPRAKMIVDIYGSIDTAKELLRVASKGYEHIFIKYHPADREDVLGMTSVATVLPSAIPVEMLFSILPFSYVIGDVSTAIMAAKWMLPESEVHFLDTKSDYTQSVESLYIDMGITPLSIDSAQGVG